MLQGQHHEDSRDAMLVTTQLFEYASVFNIGLIEFRQRQEHQRKIRDHLGSPLPWTQDQYQVPRNEPLDHQLDVTWIVFHETVHEVEHSSIRKPNGNHHAILSIRWPLETGRSSVAMSARVDQCSGTREDSAE